MEYNVVLNPRWLFLFCISGVLALLPFIILVHSMQATWSFQQKCNKSWIRVTVLTLEIS